MKNKRRMRKVISEPTHAQSAPAPLRFYAGNPDSFIEKVFRYAQAYDEAKRIRVAKRLETAAALLRHFQPRSESN